LLPNHPNPFAGPTTFRLQAPRGADVELTVYDVRGRLVSRPLERGPMATEELIVTWAGLDEAGRPLPSGVYFARLRAGDESHSRKVLLVR
jgi:hypothetical protein